MNKRQSNITLKSQSELASWLLNGQYSQRNSQQSQLRSDITQLPTFSIQNTETLAGTSSQIKFSTQPFEHEACSTMTVRTVVQHHTWWHLAHCSSKGNNSALEERKKGRKSTNYPKTTHRQLQKIQRHWKHTTQIKDAKNHTDEKCKTKTLKHACMLMHTHTLKQRLKITQARKQKTKKVQLQHFANSSSTLQVFLFCLVFVFFGLFLSISLFNTSHKCEIGTDSFHLASCIPHIRHRRPGASTSQPIRSKKVW